MSARPTNYYYEYSSVKWLYVLETPEREEILGKLGEISIEYGNEMEDFLKNS